MKTNRIFLICLAATSFACLTSCSDDSGQQTEINPPPPENTKFAALGEACGEAVECADKLECRNEICVEIVSAGKSCDKTHLCAERVDL